MYIHVYWCKYIELTGERRIEILTPITILRLQPTDQPNSAETPKAYNECYNEIGLTLRLFIMAADSGTTDDGGTNELAIDVRNLTFR